MAPTSKAAEAAAMQPVHTGYNSRQVALFSICVVFGVLSIATVGLRFYARRLQKINFYTSDWLTIPALILVLGHVASIMVAVAYGAGKHVETIMLDDPNDLIRMAKTFIASGFPWLYATCLTKLSILQMYTEFVRIKRFRMAVWVVMGLVVAFCVGQTFDYAFNCQPFAVRWNPALDGSCSSVPAEEIGGAVTNMILDIIVILLPQPVIWKLKMSPRRKILVSLVFSFGVVVIAITIVRVYYTVKTQMSSSEDTSWDLYPIGVTGGMESTMGLICACLPTLRPVFGRFFSRMQPSGQSYGDASKHRTYPTQASVNGNGNQFSRLSEDKEHLAKDSFGDSSPERFHMTALPPRGV